MDESTYVEGFHDLERVKKMTYNQLGKTGMRVSKLSLGGGPIGGVYGAVSEEEMIQTIITAIKSGVNYIDTAPWYGNGRSEEVLGKALKHIPRKAYYIATKVGRYSPDPKYMFDFSKEKVLKGFEKSLELLGLDYVDILQVHDLEFAEDVNQVINETLPAIQTLKEAGKARFLGVTGYPVCELKNVIEKTSVKINTVLSYTRNTLIDQDLKNYLPFFKEKEIGVINACAVCMGLLTMGTPPAWHPAQQVIKDAVTEAKKYCKEKNVDLARIAIQYSMRTEGIATHLMGASSKDIFNVNFDTLTSKPTDQEIKIADEIVDKFFKSLAVNNWEGQDPKQHWRVLKMIRGEIPMTDEVKAFDFSK